MKGKNNPFYGKHHSEKTKQILSQKHKKKWEDLSSVFNSKNFRKNLGKYFLGKNIRWKQRKK